MVKQNLHCHTTFDDGASTPEELSLIHIFGSSKKHVSYNILGGILIWQKADSAAVWAAAI